MKKSKKQETPLAISDIVKLSGEEYSKFPNALGMIIEIMEPNEEIGDSPLYRVEFFDAFAGPANLPRWINLTNLQRVK